MNVAWFKGDWCDWGSKRPNIAQLVERLTVEDYRSHQAVTGSNPVVRIFLFPHTLFLNFHLQSFLSEFFFFLRNLNLSVVDFEYNEILSCF